MTVKEQQLLDAVDTYVRIANTDKFDAAIWALMADPDTYIHIDAFGAAFGKEEGEAKMKGWLDQGLQMNVVETSVKINTIPGIHEVETKTNFTVATPVLEGMATEFPGCTFFTFNDNGKLIRVHSVLTGPKADDLFKQALDAIRQQSFGGTVPGQETASKALLELLKCIDMQDSKRFSECFTEDALFIDPFTFHRGKPAIASAMSKWFGMGMRSAVASFGPVAVAPFRVTSYVDHDFAGLPDDAPVQKHAIGTVVVDVDPETGKIKRCTAVPHDQLLRRWNTVLVYWLQEQKEKAQQKEAQ